MIKGLTAHPAAILNVPVKSTDAGMAVSAQGVDSMVAVDIRNGLVSTVSVKLLVSEVLRSASLKQLAKAVVEESLTPVKPNGFGGVGEV